MSPSGSTTLILPLDLGPADKFEKSNFRLAYHDGVNNIVGKGSLLLSATLDEMIKIKEMGVDLTSNPQFLLNTRLKYEDLTTKQENLEKYRKTLNPVKYILNYRAARVFYAAALTLHTQTIETSERMQRKEKEMRVVPTTEIRAVNDAGRSGANVGAVAIELPGPLNAEERQIIIDVTNTITAHATNPFVDNPQIPQLNDDDSVITLADTASLLSQDVLNDPQGEPISPSSPSYHFYFYNSVLTAGSNVHTMTLNHDSGNRGSPITEQPQP